MKNFTKTPLDFSLATHSYFDVRYQPKGYWTDVITIDVRRTWGRYNKDIQDFDQIGWEINLSHSSGGRDGKEVECDIEAHKYFAEALNQAIKDAEYLQANVALLEEEFQIADKLEKIQRRKIERENSARYDADTPLGEEGARKIMSHLAGECSYGEDACVFIHERGTDSEMPVASYKTRSGMVKYRYNGVNVSKNWMIDKLSNVSSRSANPKVS